MQHSAIVYRKVDERDMSSTNEMQSMFGKENGAKAQVSTGELNNPTVLEVKDTLEEYITIDEVSTFDGLEKTVKNHSSQFENMWKYRDIIMDILSDDGAKIKRLEDRLNPKEQDLNSACSPPLFSPQTPRMLSFSVALISNDEDNPKMSKTDSMHDQESEEHDKMREDYGAQLERFTATQANNEILHKSLDTVRSENDKLRVEISQTKEKYLNERALEMERLRTENGILHTTIEFDKTEKMRLKDSFQDLRFENDRLQNELRKIKDRNGMLEHAFSTICEDNRSMSHTTDFFNRNQTDENRSAPYTNDSTNNIPLNNRL